MVSHIAAIPWREKISTMRTGGVRPHRMLPPVLLYHRPDLSLHHRLLHVFEGRVLAHLLLERQPVLGYGTVLGSATRHQLPQDQPAGIHVYAEEGVGVEVDGAL
jgi:hypothetical protein